MQQPLDRLQLSLRDGCYVVRNNPIPMSKSARIASKKRNFLDWTIVTDPAQGRAELRSKLEIKSGKGKRKRDRLENALKWPFEKKEFAETIQKLQDFQERLSKALNLDQM